MIAGYELHSPHFTLRNSWAADLARIAAAFADDAPPDDDAAQTDDVAQTADAAQTDGALTDAA